VFSVRPDYAQARKCREVLDVLRENFDAEAQSSSGDLAIGPIDPMREAKLAVKVEGGHAVSLVGHGKVEGLQE
jgi:hypothetical protein